MIMPMLKYRKFFQVYKNYNNIYAHLSPQAQFTELWSSLVRVHVAGSRAVPTAGLHCLHLLPQAADDTFPGNGPFPNAIVYGFNCNAPRGIKCYELVCFQIDKSKK